MKFRTLRIKNLEIAIGNFLLGLMAEDNGKSSENKRDETVSICAIKIEV